MHAFFVRSESIRGERNWSVERVEDVSDAELIADLITQVYSETTGESAAVSDSTVVTEQRNAIGSTQIVTATDAIARAQATKERNERQEQTGRADLLAPIAPVPREVIVPIEPSRSAGLEQWLSGLRGAAVTIRVASRGDKKQLMGPCQRQCQAGVGTQQDEPYQRYGRTFRCDERCGEGSWA